MLSAMNRHALVVAISTGQHKSADWPVFVIGIVVVLLIVGISAWFKHR